MQTTLNFRPALFSCFAGNARSKYSKLTGSVDPRFPSPIRATAAAAYEIPTVDYSSSVSVFPAEACETIGGDACIANMHPEVKLKLENRRSSPCQQEAVERDYLDYTAYQKTVLL